MPVVSRKHLFKISLRNVSSLLVLPNRSLTNDFIHMATILCSSQKMDSNEGVKLFVRKSWIHEIMFHKYT